MEQVENKTVQEGDNVEVYCNVTAGIPDPTVIWRKVQGGGYNLTKGKLLNITNITRAQAGEYRCTANNTCGEDSTVVVIDVQCKNITRSFTQKLLNVKFNKKAKSTDQSTMFMRATVILGCAFELLL